MFDFDTLKPGALIEPEALISRGKDLRRLAFLTPIYPLCTKPALVLAPETSVARAAKLMNDGNIGAALVVCSDTVLGLLSETEVLNQLQDSRVDHSRVSVWKAMTPEPPFCLETDCVATVLRLFKTYTVRYLPVLKEYGPAVGILDMASVMEWLSDRLTAVTLDAMA